MVSLVHKRVDREKKISMVIHHTYKLKAVICIIFLYDKLINTINNLLTHQYLKFQ